MAPHKIRALVLSLLPFRESSVILYLFSQTHGLIHCVAKGIKNQKTGVLFLERGFCIEAQLYIKPSRELHTIGAIAVTDFFPATRASLFAVAQRDPAFEIILSAITQSDPHPELFVFFMAFLAALERAPTNATFPLLLWRFVYRFSGLMGFGFDPTICSSCNKPLDGDAIFMTSAGQLQCLNCASADRGALLPGSALRAMAEGTTAAYSVAASLPGVEKKRITRLLVSFCQYHFDVRTEYKSVGFLESLLQ